MPKPLFVFDYDETSVHSFDPFLRFYNHKHNSAFSREQFSYGSWQDILGINHDEIIANWIEFSRSSFGKNLKPIAQAKDYMDIFSQYGDVIILTDREPVLKQVTFDCIQKNFTSKKSNKSNISDVIFAAAYKGGGMQKVDILNDLRHVALYLEDSVKHVLNAHQEGIFTLMKNQNWNLAEHYPDNLRFNEFSELPEKLKENKIIGFYS